MPRGQRRLAGRSAANPTPAGRESLAEDPAAGEADPFDVWLQHTLREAFGAVAEEPIPEDLLRMIEEDRAEREWIRQNRAAAKPKKR